MTVRHCVICGRETHCVCEDGHAKVWLCAPELHDCFLVHRERKHHEPMPVLPPWPRDVRARP